MFISPSSQGTGRIDVKSLRWSAPPALAGTSVTAESAAAFVVGAGLRGDDGLRRDVGGDLDMLVRRIAVEGVGAMTPEFAVGTPATIGLPAALRGARAIEPAMPSIGRGSNLGALMQVAAGLICAGLAIVTVLTGVVHRGGEA